MAAATDNGAEDAQDAAAEAVTVAPDDAPARGKPGRKPKQRPEVAAPTLPEADEGQPAMDVGQPEAAVEQATAQDGGITAEMTDPAGADEGGSTPSAADMGNATSTANQDGSDQPKAAARWDRAADAVQFDWPEIERVAAQEGPNQVMAKLLVAARAEGANSRWPF